MLVWSSRNRQTLGMGVTTSESPQLDLYRHLRMTGREVISKLPEAARDPNINLLNAARKLTIPVRGRTFVFDDAGQMNVLMDFHFHEMRYGGRRIVDRLAYEENF